LTVKQNYLTKSRFKIALECPTQLFYGDNKQYANQDSGDTFLQELATGGFQVGSLAQCYYPEGIPIETKDHEAAFSQTLSLLQQKNVVIFEAAFLFVNYFIRADILIKKGTTIKLIEVKSKSICPSEDSFFNKKGNIHSNWEPYLYDITFQTWVTNQSLHSVNMGALKVIPYLMLANKEAKTSVEGLNQRFFFNGNSRKVEFNNALTTPDKLGNEILIQIKVSKEVQYLSEQTIDDIPFKNFIKKCADAITKNKIIWSGIGIKCKACGFTADAETLADGKLNGFHECWKQQAGFSDEDFKRPMSWDIWNSRKKNIWFEEKKYFIDQLNIEDFGEDKSEAFGISIMERQNIQRIKSINQDYKPYIDKKVIKQYFSEWQYPLHCIDFETTAVALPFHKGMHPYEQIAFQFSHHVIHEDGKIIHQTEWINTEPGHFPNFDFIRALKNALQTEGTIFRYSHHENSVLCQIHTQLTKSKEADKNELIKFIEEITTKKSEKKNFLWDSSRTMVDLLKVVKESYYSLYAGGSNSIKYILPAILNSSLYLQNMYSKPIYGSDKMISKNFKSFSWIKKENGLVKNPYDLLDPVFSKEEDLLLDNLLMDEECGIYDGGAAMAAYGKMQFTHMSDAERDKIKTALFRYCELDTLAMVMILQEFRYLIK
jgi:hypothetical protein